MKMFRLLFFYLFLMTLITGGVYPSLIWGIGQIFFKDKAEGSLIHISNNLVGSHLIGQAFTGPSYFWSRPSATAGAPYNFFASGGSNLNPTNKKLRERIKKEEKRMLDAHGKEKLIPLDLVTTSGSGLDPDITIEAALYQVERIAKVRKLPVHVIYNLVLENARSRTFGFLGEPRVNVLELNLALDYEMKERGTL